eukprot:Clim_evm212s157 gene=Clim_evmTU212s157
MSKAPVWRSIDATGQPVGRIALLAAHYITGKYRPTYSQGADLGDHVVVYNSKFVEFTGKKWEKKTYFSHGRLYGTEKFTKARDLHNRDPTAVIKKAVWGMLPRNYIRRRRMNRLHVHPGPDHPWKENCQPLSDTVPAEIPQPRQPLKSSTVKEQAQYTTRLPPSLAPYQDLIEEEWDGFAKTLPEREAPKIAEVGDGPVEHTDFKRKVIIQRLEKKHSLKQQSLSNPYMVQRIRKEGKAASPPKRTKWRDLENA